MGKNHEQDTLLYDFVVKIHNGFNNSLANHSLKQVSAYYCLFHTLFIRKCFMFDLYSVSASLMIDNTWPLKGLGIGSDS